MVSKSWIVRPVNDQSLYFCFLRALGALVFPKIAYDSVSDSPKRPITSLDSVLNVHLSAPCQNVRLVTGLSSSIDENQDKNNPLSSVEE